MARFVGHVNTQFPEKKVTDMNCHFLLTCPYNFTHKIPFGDFDDHIERCGDATSKKGIKEMCEYNVVHFFPANDTERELHYKNCPNLKDGKMKVKPVHEVKMIILPLPPLRHRVGIENPRHAQPPIPSLEEVLGPDVQFPELVETAEARRQRAKELTGFYVNGINVYEKVVIEGPENYGDYSEFTSKMSRAEKVRFAKFLEAEKEKWERAAYLHSKISQGKTGLWTDPEKPADGNWPTRSNGRRVWLS